MAIRVAHVGTGNAGRIALTQLIEDPRFELVALCVSTPSKIGKDAGERYNFIMDEANLVDDLDL